MGYTLLTHAIIHNWTGSTMHRKKLHRCFRLLIVVGVLIPACFADEVEEILGRMSLREKAGQMILVYNSPISFLEENAVGGVLIMKNMLESPRRLRRRLDSAQAQLPIPLLVAIDQEGGKVNRLSALPGWERVASAKELRTWALDSITWLGERTARCMNELGLNLNLAPVLDPSLNHTNRETFMEIERRSFGNDADAIVPPAKAFTTGFANHGIMCIAKHFPGYDVESNSDHEVAASDADSMAVAQSVEAFIAMNPLMGGVMMSSIHYRALCKEPAVLCSTMVSWAREVAGENVIMTDDLWGTALRSFVLPGRRIHRTIYPDSAFAKLVEMAVRAGNDVLMITYPAKVPMMLEVMQSLAHYDHNVAEQIDRAARRILILKKRMGLW
ncbi:MAG: hypothetical protein GF344_09185 [Chitinivibrionales bacterium]|nr:hypothetical protein [Chitinivibrionales bacterium]MBD3357024.1 hypothetical protein [Chitinivibrionales bacterium]